MSQPSLTDLTQDKLFIGRHIETDGASLTQSEEQRMLAYIKANSLSDLTAEIVPKEVLQAPFLSMPNACSEQQALAEMQAFARQNKVFKSYIGMGYYPCTLPAVIQRNVLENPGWYTAYTPYQPEIAQGRLQALLNYQQMVVDLTAMDLANASLLDEGTAAAEAMAMIKRSQRKNKANAFFVDENCYPQTIDVVKTRAEAFGWEVIVGHPEQATEQAVFGALLQYPALNGEITDFRTLIKNLHEQDVLVSMATDLMALIKLTPPGELGADIVFGNSQRFGVPMGFGGPHAAFFATRDGFKRSIPGRIIGVSKDAQGKPALRMALQTREQHIRREKANSNICTAQVLLANLAGFYATYHGPKGLALIAERIHRYTSLLACALKTQGLEIVNQYFFDTLTINVKNGADLLARASEAQLNLRIDANGSFGVSLHENVSLDDVQELYEVITGKNDKLDFAVLDAQAQSGLPSSLLRSSDFLTHANFNRYHTEHEMLRYIRQLEQKDLAMNHSMITLGSCTMKLNATSEMLPITWPEFAHIHPFAPQEQTQGYEAMIKSLEVFLQSITGFNTISMQPNSGAQGEYAGLLVIRQYHLSRGDSQRNLCLIPRSAHGTNPASAQMAGMRIQVVDCDEQGNVDFADLQAKVEAANESLACLMLTYPSTHGVYEAGVEKICQLVHQFGGQVYMDGANLNAQVGITSPGHIGADVTHMNLHKTFAIPHGGGGPGMGPIGVADHLAPFIANHSLRPVHGNTNQQGAVSSATYGSASILPIPWMYIRMMGADGLRYATQTALLKANYLASKLKAHYPILYTGKNGRVAHECIVDLRPIKAQSGITEVDIAKRLMDYGFHAPTMSFPVAGTFMIEPTESESLAELDRFADAMIGIKNEIEALMRGELDADCNPLNQAPHTVEVVISDSWTRPYSREQAAYPTANLGAFKFWPAVGRIDDVYGDRHLICTCPSVDEYE